MPDQEITHSIVIIGAGGFGRELLWQMRAHPRNGSLWEILGFVDSIRGEVDGLPVLGDDAWAWAHLPPHASFIVAVGDSRIRKKIFQTWQEKHFAAAHFVSHRANLMGFNGVEGGSVICAGASLTTGIQIGSNVLVNLNCTIGHDASIGSHSTLHPGVHISGNAHVGECTEIGTGAVVLPGIRVGNHVRIGANAVVNRDVPDGETWAGVPATAIR